MKVKYILSAILILAVLCLGAFGYVYSIVMSPQVELDETVYIYIDKDDTEETVVAKIVEASNLRSVQGFRLLAWHNGFDKQMRTGKYAIYNNDNMRALYHRIVSNQQTPVKVTLPSTRTVEQLVSAVCNQLMMDTLELLPFITQEAYYRRIGYTEETLPSLFLPNTYEVYWNISPEKFMIRIMKEHRAFWNESRMAKAKAIGLTPAEVATLASIVDEETNSNSEKPIVAGLYLNRLKRGMLLQADPTVKFAIGDFTRKRILNADLETDSPYNTYKYKGLPPGPIRIPTLQAIESVLNHAKHNYIYMCAKEDFSGEHNFATTLSAHNANARKYREALNKLRIKK